MKKVILSCDLSPGDIVMLTAALRDLHHWYPGQFKTDVRTLCPDLWLNNPHITPIRDDDPKAERIKCSYPLINRANEAPYHCLHGFIDFLNQHLGLQVKPTVFKGDIHLSAQEKAWFSQVYEVARHDIPFWIVAAGGKHDITIKWWQSSRYQEVVDHFRGKIQFVQVGQAGDYHPRLEGVIDLRRRTTLRELIRLVYHAQGVLCTVTALMHLAAAVETKEPQARVRPCVVIAGGREPAHWEAYPGHQFVHTIGALKCCSRGGCWKDRAVPLRDGNHRDRRDRRCESLVQHLPRCLDLITPEAVIDRIEVYFRGGACRYLSPSQRKAAIKGMAATCSRYEREPLNIHTAGVACDEFVQRMPPCPSEFAGRGVVICGGGDRYFASAWVCINMLRHVGCELPVQLWYLGRKEMNAGMLELLSPLRVECIDAVRLRRRIPCRILGGWELKAYALACCQFQEVLLLDADNMPVRNPEFLFIAAPYRKSGAVFWPDLSHRDDGRASAIWRSCGLKRPDEPEFESGQILVDKERCWRALRLALWFNENSDFYYRYIHGDKETFHLAFRKLCQPYALVRHPVRVLPYTMCQQDFQGRRLFQHRNSDKWKVAGSNHRVMGFQWETLCRRFVAQLRLRWAGHKAQDL